MIYVIQQGQAGPIKIGYTQDTERLHGRLKSLQSGNPTTLHIRATFDGGGPVSERKLHKALGGYRMRGEWFKWNKATKFLVASMQGPGFNALDWSREYIKAAEALRARFRKGKRVAA